MTRIDRDLFDRTMEQLEAGCPDGVRPPRAVVGAMAEATRGRDIEQSISFRELDQRTTSWKVTALVGESLAIVDAKAGRSDWAYDRPSDDDTGPVSLSGQVLPLATVATLRFVATVTRRNDRMTQEMSQMIVQPRWELSWPLGHPVYLPAGQGSTDGTVAFTDGQWGAADAIVERVRQLLGAGALATQDSAPA